MPGDHKLYGYLRHDGRKGIRNYLVVCYLVECAHHVARAMVNYFPERGVHLIGFGGCYPNAYASRMLTSLCTHPNVGAVLLVSLGCESFDRANLEEAIRQSGRPVDTLVIQQVGGTRKTIEEGRAWIESTLSAMESSPNTVMAVNELVIGTVCGGSDSTSGITANPAIGRAFDLLTAQNATAIFEETGELIGCEHIMAQRAVTGALADELIAVVAKAARYYAVLEHGSFALGNAEGGLTTQEEKSMGAYSKSGSSKISGILKPGDVPPWRPLSARHSSGRAGSLRLSQHQRQCGDRGADRVWLAPDFIFHGAGKCRRFGHLTRDQNLRQPTDFSSHGGRHGHQRRPHS